MPDNFAAVFFFIKFEKGLPGVLIVSRNWKASSNTIDNVYISVLKEIFA